MPTPQQAAHPRGLTALEELLVASGGQHGHIAKAAELTGGLGFFIRSLVGLDRAAAVEAFADYLDGSKFSVDQVRFVNLIVDELTANGIVEPARVFESPYTDHAPTGPGFFFPDADVAVIVETLHEIKQHAIPTEAAKTPRPQRQNWNSSQVHLAMEHSNHSDIGGLRRMPHICSA